MTTSNSSNTTVPRDQNDRHPDVAPAPAPSKAASSPPPASSGALSPKPDGFLREVDIKLANTGLCLKTSERRGERRRKRTETGWNWESWDPILSYINQQYEQYLQEELLITRQRHIPDTRVHCCVYFVPPTGHCLRPLDIEFLRRLCRTVNVVPVIARADSLTIEERDAFRSRIQQNLKTHCIDVYPQKCFDEDLNDQLLNSKIREQIPFAVVGADREHLVNGRCVLGRKTKWGIIEVENMAHCEFLLLRDLLIRSHLQDLKDITHNVHYENYRVLRLNESHLLPRGPGWVNLAPASPGQLTSPGPAKARKRAAKDSREEEC
ncbi:hypothetical protein STEG23_004167 [Scotinomys teguina]